MMSLWKKSKFSKGKMEIDPKALSLRLQSLLEQSDVEIMQLALESIVEELEDYKQQSSQQK